MYWICVNVYSLTAVVPLHTQWLTAIGRLQQLELQQDGLVQVSAHKRLVVEDRNSDHWGVHYRVSGKPEGRERAELDILVRVIEKRQRQGEQRGAGLVY